MHCTTPMYITCVVYTSSKSPPPLSSKIFGTVRQKFSDKNRDTPFFSIFIRNPIFFSILKGPPTKCFGPVRRKNCFRRSWYLLTAIAWDKHPRKYEFFWYCQTKIFWQKSLYPLFIESLSETQLFSIPKGLPLEKFGTVRINLTKIVGIYAFFSNTQFFSKYWKVPATKFWAVWDKLFLTKSWYLVDAITYRTQKKAQFFSTQKLRLKMLSKNQDTPFFVV